MGAFVIVPSSKVWKRKVIGPPLPVLGWLGLGLIMVLLSACGSHVYHQVRKGDTLYSISWRYHQDYHQVAAWNDISPPYVIHEGEWVRVAPPKPGSSPKRVAAAQSPVKPQAAKPQAAVPEKSPSPPPAQAGRQPACSKASPNVPKSPSLVDPADGHWPVPGPIVHRFNPAAPGKKGIDLAGTRGAPVRAAAAGRVVYSGNGLRGYGNLLIVKHSEKFLSAYAHNQKLLVKEGEHVRQGQIIAKMGSTEIDRVLLHFEIRLNGKPVDPLHYLPKRGT